MKKSSIIIDSTTDAVVTTDIAGNITYWNRGAEVIYGYKRDEVIGKPVGIIYKEEDQHILKAMIEDLLQRKAIPSFELTCINKNRNDVEILLSLTTVSDRDGNIIELVGITKDITERKKKERDLDDYRNKLRSLVSELTIAEDRERKNIASLLHDDLLQKLALSKMKLSMLRETLESNEQLDNLDHIHDYVSEMFEDMRSLTLDLCPPILYDIGLEAAVRDWLQKEMAENQDINVNLETDGQDLHLDEDLRIALYRAIREVLMNILKHAQAKNVNVGLTRTDAIVTVEVQDDGIGFEQDEIKADGESPGGLGLFTIRERMEHFGGSLQIESTPGKGTRVILTAALTDR
jgi:PAS domain S-box-containing protein